MVLETARDHTLCFEIYVLSKITISIASIMVLSKGLGDISPRYLGDDVKDTSDGLISEHNLDPVSSPLLYTKFLL